MATAKWNFLDKVNRQGYRNGHYSAGFTLDTYTHTTQKMRREAADTIGNAIDRQPQNGGNGMGYQKDLAYTLTATDHHAVFSRQRVDRVCWKSYYLSLKRKRMQSFYETTKKQLQYKHDFNLRWDFLSSAIARDYPTLTYLDDHNFCEYP